MSKEKRRVPRLRFPGFTGDWEQRKLGNLATVEMNKRIFKEQTTTKGDIPFYKIGTFGSDADSFISRELFEEYKNKYPYPNIGDILISASGSIGRTVVYNGEDAYYQDSNIVWLNHNGQIDNSFLLQFYNQVKWAGLEGSTIKRLYNKNILETNIALPKIEEQRSIGKFFKLVDSSITLHQRKLNHLILKKKSLLQKLFPKNGDRYPELRFPEFTGDWEQRKLGDCMNSFAYGLNAAAKDYDGMHKYIRITDIDDETHNFIQSNLTSPDIDFNMDVSDYKLNVGDIVFARTGASVGKTYLYNPNDGDLYYAGFLIRGTVKEDCDAGFIYQNTLTKEYDSFIRTTSQRSGQPGVNSKEYATFRLNIPCKDEQEKISKVLHSLDELFTLHQRKLDHLQLQKKALLQQMFV